MNPKRVTSLVQGIGDEVDTMTMTIEVDDDRCLQTMSRYASILVALGNDPWESCRSHIV